MFGRKKKPKELTQQHLEQYRRVSGPPQPPPIRWHTEQPDDTELNLFLAELRPNEYFTFDESDALRHHRAVELAKRPLTAYLEDQAILVARLVTETRQAGGHRSEELRAVGQSLGQQGGAFLMVLVALRAPYAEDPGWKAKHAEAVRQARERGAVVNTSAGGPMTRRLEYQWKGICGWQS